MTQGSIANRQRETDADRQAETETEIETVTERLPGCRAVSIC
jgi:hypothetical protein